MRPEMADQRGALCAGASSPPTIQEARDGDFTPPTLCLFALTFEALPEAVLLVSASKEILFANRAAHRLAMETGAFLLEQSLQVKDSAIAGMLDAAIGEIAPKDTVLRGDASAPARHAAVLPVADGAGRILFCIRIMEDRATGRFSPAAPLQARYRLTASEEAVALMLTEGRRVNEIAQVRGVSEHTVRAQLKSLFGKLGVKSQVQATALLCRLLAEQHGSG